MCSEHMLCNKCFEKYKRAIICNFQYSFKMFGYKLFLFQGVIFISCHTLSIKQMYFCMKTYQTWIGIADLLVWYIWKLLKVNWLPCTTEDLLKCICIYVAVKKVLSLIHSEKNSELFRTYNLNDFSINQDDLNTAGGYHPNVLYGNKPLNVSCITM